MIDVLSLQVFDLSYELFCQFFNELIDLRCRRVGLELHHLEEHVQVL